MSLLTIFSAPKPFTNPHINIIQRNAVQSWKLLGDVNVILIGDEPGIPDVCKEFGIINVPDVDRDEKGVPLVSSIMEKGHAYSDSPIICYANADMILMSDILTATRQVSSQVKDFLLISQRWNLDVSEPINFSEGWETRLREEVETHGKFFSPWGIDYFIFPRHMYSKNIPDFTIGRPAWDNWMVYTAIHDRGLAVDATRSVMAVHQNHDYSHLPGNKPSNRSEVADSNLAKAGGVKKIYNILDANRELIQGRIRRPRPNFARMLRHIERWLTPAEKRGVRWEMIRWLKKVAKPYATIPRR